MTEIFFGRRIGAIRRHLRRELEVAATAHDITATQFQVLRRLWSGEGMNAQNLAKESHLDAATMTGVLDRLEHKRLVRRERDESDRRAVKIVLTEAGRALEAPLAKIVKQVNEHALAGLSDSEREQLFGFLERIERNLEEKKTKESHE
ncbi:DNA-binding transcriptional regulator, MarR family [Abditibacterium utsteinense]|uniref:DNA-binding transcriptional regulator, MarR family n=1 Tax=Abditibacterium utsteinense TaxID=1960156 RepID=A0A2S8SS08_9BACT|nr:MarR family transcriptional regulator [Abditibacterium utsteinense]PQV63575.1 DNA-binding transcriptional regulator, MarR family [Abditibacterium utsteinense]